jgi:4'-phosphopantetheinyl transferase
VLKYYHVKDAKLSLGSQLLKRYVISRYCCVPWWQAVTTRDERTKPIFLDKRGRKPIAFNVSHQAGFVALAAVHGYGGETSEETVEIGVDIGVDIVCTSERRDRDQKMILDDGWNRFVDIHADVFSPKEVSYLKYQILAAVPGLQPGSSVEDIIDFKLRCFYTLWCLREAYVKMTGDALLASWLPDLEFVNFRPPEKAAAIDALPEEGNIIREHHIIFQGHKDEDANVVLRALGPDYMTCTAVRTPAKPEDGLAFELGPFEPISIDEIVEFGETHSNEL